jgi:hypothetical protein
MPMVMRRLDKLREEIKEDFPDVQIFMERPDCAIAFGAAIYAANLDRLTFVAPYTYGIYIGGGANYDMILKNEPMRKYADGKYISAKRNYEFDTSRMRDLRMKVYERDDRYAGGRRSSPGEIQPATFGFKPTLDIFVPVYAVGGRLGKHNLLVELKLAQGEPIQARLYDEDQNGQEIMIEEPPEIFDIEEDDDEAPEISRDDSRHEIMRVMPEEREHEPERKNILTGIINWLRRIWRRLFSKE